MAGRPRGVRNESNVMVDASNASGNGTTTRELLSHHREDLRRSGLSDETIALCGFCSETNPATISATLGWNRVSKKTGPALVIPYRSLDGHLDNFRRLKLDTPRKDSKGKPIKYEARKGEANRVYIPPRTVEILKERKIRLLVVEGEKKSAKADQDGFPCIGLPGVFGFCQKNTFKLPCEMEGIEWRGREVVIVFDSDVADKPELQQAEIRLAARLGKLGAKVKVLRLPPGEGGTKVGVDDYLIAHGAAALHKLINDEAREPDEADAGQEKINVGELDTMPTARQYVGEVATVKEGNTSTLALRYFSSEFFGWRRTHYRRLPEDEVRSGLMQWLDTFSCRITKSPVANILACIQSETLVSSHRTMPCWLCSDPPFPADELLPTQSGLIHLPSLIAGREYLHPSTPRFFSTQCLTYAFDPQAPRPDAWLAFLAQLWRDDPQSISTLQEWFGYCLLHDTRLQKMLLLVGPKRSGKGTIARVLRALIGEENVAGPTLAGLGTNFGLWPLLGKQLAIISDARLSGRTDSAVVTERLLSISGEDALTIDRKCLQPVTVKLPTRLMILTNELPRLGDSSGALAGRMVVLVLTQSFYGREDHDLTDKVLAELPSILLWAIAGWERLRARGRFVQPDAGRELTGEMEDLTSPVGKFVREWCIVDPTACIGRQELYEAYRRWCEGEGKRKPEDQATFGRDLRAAVPTVRDARQRDGETRVRSYVGIELRP
jgi:putative DNA primase/helicase